MAPLIGPAFAAVVATLALIPLASAQQPTTVTVVATPVGAWNNDGYVDAGAEIARWGLNATVVFSQTAVCTEPTKVKFQVFDGSGKATGAAAEPPEEEVTVPPGGGTRYVNGQALFGLQPDLPGASPYTMRLQVQVENCPNSVTSTRAFANATLGVTTLFRPGLDVQYTNRSDAGRFEVTARNTGNGPMLVAITVAPNAGAPTQPVALPPATGLVAGASASMTVAFPEKKVGRYTFTAVGSFNGPNPEDQRRAEFSGTLDVTAPTVVTTKKDSPGAEVASILAVLAIAAMGRRRY